MQIQANVVDNASLTIGCRIRQGFSVQAICRIYQTHTASERTVSKVLLLLPSRFFSRFVVKCQARTVMSVSTKARVRRTHMYLETIGSPSLGFQLNSVVEKTDWEQLR
jgi:hypothetical protein